MILIACGPFLRESHESGVTLRQLAGDVLRDTPSVSLAPGVKLMIRIHAGGREGGGVANLRQISDGELKLLRGCDHAS